MTVFSSITRLIIPFVPPFNFGDPTFQQMSATYIRLATAAFNIHPHRMLEFVSLLSALKENAPWFIANLKLPLNNLLVETLRDDELERYHSLYTVKVTLP